MCGIAGFIDIGSADPTSAITGMLEVLEHRGPDDRGFLLKENVALGMTRLSIIDIDGGRQPQTAADGAVSIVFNGEIYNHVGLRRDLERHGRAFRTRSDTEVLLASYLEWGPDAISRLDGMFAVAIHDARFDRLLLARDRFGEKPLYYWPIGTGLAFASEPKALQRIHSMPDIDETVLADYLQLGYTPGTKTIWSGLHKLAAGHLLMWEGQSFETKPYWRLQVALQSEPIADTVEAFEKRLLEAVGSRLVSDVPVGVMLSGGVDSSLVAWAASRHISDLRTFTVAFDDPARDESAAARSTAAALGTSHHETRVGGEEALAVVDQLPKIYDEPFADASAIPSILLARFIAHDVKVVLTGDGGDEVFSGYRRYARLARATSRPKLPAPLVRSVGRLAPSSSRLASRIGMAAALRDPSPTRGYENMAGLLTTFQLRRLLKGERPAALRAAVEDTFRRFGPTGPQAADVQLYLTDDLLVKMDRATMAFGLEARAPLLMPSLVEWGLSLPPTQRGAAGAKRLPRSLLGRVLPGDLAQRPKQGFSVPLGDWLRGPLRQSLVDALGDSYLVGQGYVDQDFLTELVARLDRRRPAAAPVLWAMICFERWRQHWKAG